MIEPTTAMPVSDPATAAERSGWRSPPIAMIIGNTGPEAIPAAANAAMESGSRGTNTAAAIERGHGNRAGDREPQVIEPVRDDRRDQAPDSQAGPVQRQGEGRRRQRCRLEEANDPLETPTSEAT